MKSTFPIFLDYSQTLIFLCVCRVRSFSSFSRHLECHGSIKTEGEYKNPRPVSSFCTLPSFYRAVTFKMATKRTERAHPTNAREIRGLWTVYDLLEKKKESWDFLHLKRYSRHLAEKVYVRWRHRRPEVPEDLKGQLNQDTGDLWRHLCVLHHTSSTERVFKSYHFVFFLLPVWSSIECNA